MIVRSPRPERGFTVLDNLTIRDPRLSWKARGILIYLLSMPDNWRANSEHLTHVGPDGRDSIRAGLRELEQARYLVRRRVRDDRGRWHTETVVFDRPQPVDGNVWTDPAPEPAFPASDNPAVLEAPTNNDVGDSSSRYARVCYACNGDGAVARAGIVVVCPACNGGRVI